jgi:membrane fusion protein (multidrug efflux system)
MNISHKMQIAGAATLAVAAIAGFLILNQQESDARTQGTDDAYVQADLTVLSPRVSGVIARVSVNENQAVQRGATLLDIDDRDLRIAVDSARADVAMAQATVNSLQAQISRQKSAQDQARASIAATNAGLALAEANDSRYSNLARDGAGTVQAQQQAAMQLKVQRANGLRDQASLVAVNQQTDVLRAECDKARAGLAHARAVLAAAELNLSYAHITAPVAGIVAQRSARVGAYTSPGKPLLTLVPLQAIYVEANYRETQLTHVRVGQSVAITVDALPGITIHGKVESLAPASGTSYSLVAPHNATGNFTKIVQRLPVRIRLEQGQQALQSLRVGMSVHPEIHT